MSCAPYHETSCPVLCSPVTLCRSLFSFLSFLKYFDSHFDKRDPLLLSYFRPRYEEGTGYFPRNRIHETLFFSYPGLYTGYFFPFFRPWDPWFALLMGKSKPLFLPSLRHRSAHRPPKSTSPFKAEAVRPRPSPPHADSSRKDDTKIKSHTHSTPQWLRHTSGDAEWVAPYTRGPTPVRSPPVGR